FDYDKLLWFNGEYIRKLNFEAFYALAESYLKQVLSSNFNLAAVGRLLQGRIQKLSEIPAMIDFIAALPDYDPALFTHKKNKTNPELAAKILAAAQPLLTSLTDWNNDLLYEKLQNLARELEIKSGAVMWVIRIAVAGKAATPGGATEIMELLGQTESLQRLQLAQSKLS
ncbi:MAG: glutamate--tRNA ligase, partial [Clostridia bacterium]|nr:glutamate--tRNA ligase [Clostridia bacterium]